MSQHDYVISNDIGSAVRADINNALGAIATINSGATEPSTTYAYQLWMDTSNNVLKIRNSANSAWYTLPISPVANNTVDINGGTVDGVTIGASSAGAITGTTITGTSFVSSGDMTFGDNDKAIFGAGSDLQIYHDGTHSYVDDAGTGNLKVRSSGAAIQFQTISGDDIIYANTTGAVDLYYAGTGKKLATTSTGIDVTGTVTADGLTVDAGNVLFKGGDISFYEDTGTTAKFFWDASAESLGIGTSSPAVPLHVSGYVLSGGQNYSARFSDAVNSTFSIGHQSGLTNLITDAGMAFYASSAERMRIDSSGNLLVGRTSDSGFTGRVSISENGAVSHMLKLNTTNTSGTQYMVNFSRADTGVGSITTGTSSTAYNTSSDYRLKEDWQPMSGSIDRLKALNPVNFAWKADGSRVDGFLAHEAAEVVPEAVTGEKDAVEAIGNITDAEGTVVQENVTEPAELAEGQTWTKTEDRPVYQGIDQSKLTPLLTAALQEAIAKIEALETRIAALEA